MGSAAPTAQAKDIIPSRGCIYAILAVAGLTVGYLSPNIYHDVSGVTSGNRHIGHGIHMDWENLKAHLTQEERALLQAPKKNAHAIIAMFASKLDVVYDSKLETSIRWFPETHYASQYFSDEAPSAVCRHQVRVLAAVLEELEIEAEIWQGYSPNLRVWHAWVQVPSLNLVADPSLTEPLPIPRYHEDFKDVHRVSYRSQWVSNVIY